MSFTVDEDVFSAFCFYSGILALKFIVMSPLTARQRLARGVFANKEDTPLHKKGKVEFGNENVERVRRAHQNDIENIFPFFILGALYMTTNPAAFVAINIFRVFTAARIIHTIVYLNQVPQPSRALSYGIATFCNTYMAGSLVYNYL